MRLNAEYKQKKLTKVEYLKKAIPILKDIVENHKEEYSFEIYSVYKKSYDLLKEMNKVLR